MHRIAAKPEETPPRTAAGGPLRVGFRAGDRAGPPLEVEIPAVPPPSTQPDEE
jgi:hypothetical protein